MAAGLLVERYDSTFTTKIDTYQVKASTGQIMFNDVGQTTVTVPNKTLVDGAGDPRFPADGDIMLVSFQPNVKVNTFVPVHPFRVEKPHRIGISTQEKAGEVTHIVGRSVLSDLDRTSIKPHGTTKALPDHNVRRFYWGSPEVDRTGATASVKRATVSDRTTDIPHNRAGNPRNFPLPTARELSANADPGTGNADPDGPTWHYFEYTTTVEQQWLMNMTGDDLVQIAVDGVEVLSYTEELGDATRGTFVRLLTVPPGDHVIAVRLENLHRESTVNCSFFCLATSDNGGTNEQWLFSTASNGWRSFTYGTPEPAFYPGEVFNILLDECQAEGEAPGWSCSATAAHDSDGTAWPERGQFSFDVGDSLLDALFKMRDEGWIDFDIDVMTFTVNLYVQGQLGSDKSGTYTAALPVSRSDRNSWLRQLEHELDYSTKVTGLRVRDDLGWFTVGTGPRRKKLTLSGIKDRAESTRIATEALTRMTEPERSVTAEINPPSASQVALPSTWWLGDSITVPNEVEADSVARLMSLSWTLDDSGMRFTYEFHSVRKDRLSRLARVQNRMIGALGGRSESASVISPLQPAQSELQDESIEWTWSGPANGTTPITSGPSPVKKATKLWRIQRLELECKIPDDAPTLPTGSTTVKVYADGVQLGTAVTMGPATGSAVVFLNPPVVVGPGAELHCVATAAGSHPNGTVSAIGTLLPQ